VSPLAGRVALVTGGSKGIGYAIAGALRSAGAHVVISSRKQDALDLAVASLRKIEGDGELLAVAANAGEPDQAEACVSGTVERFGALDILVNNAATNPYMGPLVGLDLARAEKTARVNQYGPLLWTQLAWHAHLKEHGGAVLNISSVGGLVPDPGIGYYNATKAALIYLTRQLAYELGPAVRVNAIAPGLVKTDMARRIWQEREEILAASLPLRRLGTPEDIARAAVFLVGDDASWITGQTLVIDGGATVLPIGVDAGPSLAGASLAGPA
jgi:NAD(P)-dependent dehydrogenase (short-subunit alcohol dehydrogenase family)